MGNTASSNVGNPKPGRPPVSYARIIGEVLAALAATGVVSGLGIVIIMDAWGFYFWLLLVCPFLIPPAAAITVCLIGILGEQTGSFWATLGLSVVGTIPFVMAVVAYMNVLFFWCTLLGPSLGAVVGFNLTRRYKETFAPKNVARKGSAQKDFFQLKKEFESKLSGDPSHKA